VHSESLLFKLCDGCSDILIWKIIYTHIACEDYRTTYLHEQTREALWLRAGENFSPALPRWGSVAQFGVCSNPERHSRKHGSSQCPRPRNLSDRCWTVSNVPPGKAVRAISRPGIQSAEPRELE